MFERRWFGFGKLVSDEGFTLYYAHRSITYSDLRGDFEFGFEDGLLFPKPHQVKGAPTELNSSELDEILNQVVRGIQSEGYTVEVSVKSVGA